MPVMELKKDDLQKYLSDSVEPIIKNYIASSEVRDIIRENVESLIKSDSQEGAAANLVTGAAQPLAPQQPQGPKDPMKLGLDMGCYVRAMAAGRNDRMKAAKFAEKWDRPDVARALIETEEKAMSAGDPLGGGFLVPTQFSNEIIELLRASGVVRSLMPTSIPMPNGTIKVPKITSGSTASYIGENTNVPKSEVQTGQLELSWKKLAALVPLSNDLIRYSGPSADMVVRDDMVRALAAREDLAFIQGDGTSGTPKGIKNWINGANVFTANVTVNLANVTTDLGTAMQNLMDANINLVIQQGGTGAIDVRPGWLFNPQQWKYLTTVQTGLGTHAFRDEMLGGTLWGYPFRVSTQVDSTEVYFGAFAHAVIGEAAGLMVDASQEAAYHDGSSVVAAFSQDQTVIRVISEHDFALRYDKAFSLIDTVTWGS